MALAQRTSLGVSPIKNKLCWAWPARFGIYRRWKATLASTCVDFTQHAVFMVKILVQTKRRSLEMGAGAVLPGKQAAAVTATQAGRSIAAFSLHSSKHGLTYAAAGQLHMVADKQAQGFRTGCSARADG